MQLFEAVRHWQKTDLDFWGRRVGMLLDQVDRLDVDDAAVLQKVCCDHAKIHLHWGPRDPADWNAREIKRLEVWILLRALLPVLLPVYKERTAQKRFDLAATQPD